MYLKKNISFSILVNKKQKLRQDLYKTCCVQLVFFDNIEHSHKDDYSRWFTVIERDMKKNVWNYCFEKHCKKNYTILSCVYFCDEKMLQKCDCNGLEDSNFTYAV